MRGRRYFEQAQVDGAKSGKTLAEVGLQFYQKLYDLDDESKKLDLSEKQKHRLENHKPIWDEFKAWVDINIKKVRPKSKLGKALNYFTKSRKLRPWKISKILPTLLWVSNRCLTITVNGSFTMSHFFLFVRL